MAWVSAIKEFQLHLTALYKLLIILQQATPKFLCQLLCIISRYRIALYPSKLSFNSQVLRRCDKTGGLEERWNSNWFKWTILLKSDKEFHNFALASSRPWLYADLKLPNKLPPMKVAISLDELPLPGYLEQTVAYVLRNALAMCSKFRPKYPFLTPERSALVYMALQLKGESAWQLSAFLLLLNKLRQHKRINCEFLWCAKLNWSLE